MLNYNKIYCSWSLVQSLLWCSVYVSLIYDVNGSSLKIRLTVWIILNPNFTKYCMVCTSCVSVLST